MREGALHLPGIAALSETGLRTSFDPALVLRRFEARFRVPDTVTLGVRGTTLVLSGEAPHAWLARVREGGTAVPGITALDEANLIDVDLRNFQQTKSVIESAFIYFLVNKDNFATEGFAALSRLPEEIRKCETAAKRLGIALTVQVLGYADGVGQEAKNLDLSQRRAEAVRKFLVTCGLDAALFSAVAGGPPPPSADGKPTSEQSDRRVAFRIVSPP